eukprot:TRINITY_DN28231_c0_g1_i1.p1 TRINITY_DN28231_c0_g1~~TRINITY_DN28231_c0_g1_i1.p1  ORF type:complete len:296 (+),score=43.27 TRINITY_DN28231_c0_g1_i1:85-972(+)
MAKPATPRGGSSFRWNPGESYLHPASLRALLAGKSCDATVAAMKESSLGRQAQMGPDWTPAGLACRRIAEDDLKRRRGHIDRSKLPRPPAQTGPTAAAPGGLQAAGASPEMTLNGGRSEVPLSVLKDQFDLPTSTPQRAISGCDDWASVSREVPGRTRLQQSALQPSWWPGEPVPHSMASSSSLQAPPPRRPATAAEASGLGCSQTLASTAKTSLGTSADTAAILEAAHSTPRATTANPGTPRTRNQVYPFNWRPTETSLIRDSFNTIINKEQADVTKMMQTHASMGRKAQWSGL